MSGWDLEQCVCLHLVFDFRIIPNCAIDVAGFVFSGLVLIICGLPAVTIVLYTKEPLTFVLDALAIFFLLDFDNFVVSKDELDRSRALMKERLNEAKS